MTKKRHTRSNPEHAEIIATYTKSIDRKMKGEQLRRHTAWQVWTQLEGETAAFACLYTTDHKCMIPTLPPPTSTSPSPTTSRVNRWRVWSNEIHEDRDNHLRVHVHSLIWMMIHIGREVNSPETLLMGGHVKGTKQRAMCMDVCERLCLRSGGKESFYMRLLCRAHHL